MTCNCNRNGDVEYTITLNQQGPQGRQGNVGQDGFSPIITVQSNTEANYQLKIITSDGEIITPNLKGQTPNLPTGIVTTTGANVYRGSNTYQGPVYLFNTTNVGGIFTFEDKIGDVDVEVKNENGVLKVNNNAIITEPEFDELADDVVDINSQLAGLSFKKYTEAEYESITNPDANTLYMVTNPDGNTFKLYLGSIELEGGGGGTVVAGGIATNNISGYTKSTLNNISTTVTAEPYTA